MKIAERFGKLLREKKLTVAVAESCTGGLICKMITDVAGSSDYFDGGFITYSNAAKINILGVDHKIIETYGAVSAECAGAMARKIKDHTGCGICISITGIAGPGGGTSDKPVGLVYAGFIIKNRLIIKKMFFKGSRIEMRKQTAHFCLGFAAESLEQRGK
jgi:PncC family amidohydrolase